MYENKIKKLKEVQVVFEYYDKSDLSVILDDLKEKLCQGIETYHTGIKSRYIEEKEQILEFIQFYKKTDRISKEQEINGELKLVIKSNI